ncbi:MAG: ribosome silencing factor [Bacteroidia bacterium]
MKKITTGKAVKKTAPKKTTKPAKAVKAKSETPKTAVKKAAPKKTTPRKTASKKEIQQGEYTALELAKVIAQGMFEKKAEDIRILDMRGLAGASTDFFVISHATSDKQVEAIADSAEEEVHKKAGYWPIHREGYENLEWILLDYFDVVAHIFQQEKREFFAIEELWGDAKEVSFKGK